MGCLIYIFVTLKGNIQIGSGGEYFLSSSCLAGYRGDDDIIHMLYATIWDPADGSEFRALECDSAVGERVLI